MTLTIQAGKYYRRRDGRVVGPASVTPNRVECGGVHYVNKSGRYDSSNPAGNLDLIAEAFISDTPSGPPCELVAGREYETEKPDGTAGPVVKLIKTSFSGKAHSVAYPFYANGWPAAASPMGKCLDIESGDLLYRIVRPFITPKAPIERLKELRDDVMSWKREAFDSIIADLEANK